MKDQILFIGLDVDDQAYHGGVCSQDGQIEKEFRCKPTVGALLSRLRQYEEKGFELKVCYEATYLGFSLCRALRSQGIHCDVIAPSLIPEKPGKKVKTDRIDGNKLAKYYSTNLLTLVRIPDLEEETARDLVRTRRALNEKVKETKLQIGALCRRQGWQYREPGKKDSYWTVRHLQWLREHQRNAKQPALRFNLEHLLNHLEQEQDRVEKFDVEIERLARSPLYWPRVQALCCYRGINILMAMIFILELGDIARFDHPKRITSFAGMDLMEASSGGKESKFHMTKMGNRHVRWAAIEACQSVLKIPKVSRDLKQRRQNVDEKYIAIADKCHARLYKKASRLLYAGKMKNKIKVAAARELLGFVWESLRAAA